MVESAKTGSEEFGDLLRLARERLGMSRRDLAEATGLSYPYISQLETGYRLPSAPALRSLADSLDLPPDRLFEAIPRDRGPAALAAAAAPAPAVPAPSPGAPSAGAPLVADASPVARASPALGAPAPAGAPLSVGAPHPPDGWFDNPRHDPVTDPSDDESRSRTVVSPTTRARAGGPTRERAVAEAVRGLTGLPPSDRLDALGEVQARVVQSVIDDELGRRRL